jgi:hypothetical protein
MITNDSGGILPVKREQLILLLKFFSCEQGKDEFMSVWPYLRLLLTGGSSDEATVFNVKDESSSAAASLSVVTTESSLTGSIRAGLPTAVQLSGIAFTTTDPDPIFTLCPIRIFPRILAPQPTETLFPNFGCRSPLSLPVPPYKIARKI